MRSGPAATPASSSSVRVAATRPRWSTSSWSDRSRAAPPRERARDGDRMAQHHGEPAGERRRLVREAELPQDRELVEVVALADEPIALEHEVRAVAAAKRA